MKRLEQWMAEGKIAQFVLGKLSPAEYQEILEAAKEDRAVAEAVNLTKAELMAMGLANAKTQDPDALIASGMLEAYINGNLSDEQRQVVELMVAAHPQVGNAFHEIKGRFVTDTVKRVHAEGAQVWLDSDRLIEYVLGECDETARIEVELAASLYPEVQAELSSWQSVMECLILESAAAAPGSAKDRFSGFLEASTMPADGWTLIMPPLTEASKPEDFVSWLDRIHASDINPTENLTAVPLDVNRDVTTLFVVVNEFLEEEIHLNSIERFLVLQGSCIIRMGEVDIVLQQGDYYSIPKYVSHTVIVTSEISCKLIVQQVAA